jgi:hypothetical protein
MLLASVGVGVILSVVIITVANRFFPSQGGLVKSGSDDGNSNSKKNDDEKDVCPQSTHPNDDPKSEEKVATNGQSFYEKRQKEIGELYGLTGNPVDDNRDINYIKVLDWLVFIGLIVALVMVTHNFADSDFVRFLAGLFPKEFETLGLSKYLASRQPMSNDAHVGMLNVGEPEL